MNPIPFLITVDTEGDDLWHWQPGKEITTENVRFIPRFQELCEKYGFKPVFLTNHEMAMDDRWVSYAGEKARQGKCEIGMHLHAWNTPPEYPLENRYGGNPYITEYPAEIADAKVKTMMDLLQDRFEMPVITHRAGRWATNEAYFASLARHGIKIDCSVTPELDLSRIPGCSQPGGTDYRKAQKGVYEIYPGILEISMTTRKLHHACYGSVKHKAKAMLLGEKLWLRPIQKKIEPLMKLTRKAMKEDGYLEFMIHSSELMPGGSIYFKDEESVEGLYALLEQYFATIVQMGYVGMTMTDFAHQWKRTKQK